MAIRLERAGVIRSRLEIQVTHECLETRAHLLLQFRRVKKGLDVVPKPLKGREHGLNVLGVELEGDLDQAGFRDAGLTAREDSRPFHLDQPSHLRQGEIVFGDLDNDRAPGTPPRSILGEELQDLASNNAAEKNPIPNHRQDVHLRPDKLRDQVVQVSMWSHLHRDLEVQRTNFRVPRLFQQRILVEQAQPLIAVDQGQMTNLKAVHHAQYPIHGVRRLRIRQRPVHQSLCVHGVNLALANGMNRGESFRKVRMTRLSVNVNKIATLRNARGGSIPDVLQAAVRIQEWGAHGITVHPRPDARHITFADVRSLRPVVHTEFNVEGFPSPEFLALVLEVKPDQVTLVPDPPDAKTSQAGWKAGREMEQLPAIVDGLRRAGIRTSLFVAPDADDIMAAQATGTDRIELYTEPYAVGYRAAGAEAAVPFGRAAAFARSLGLGVNAGHDLDRTNLADFVANVPHLLEVSIGHALISDALYLGLEATVKAYLDTIAQGFSRA